MTKDGTGTSSSSSSSSLQPRHHSSRLRSNSRHSVAAGLFTRHASLSAASSRYSSPSPSTSNPSSSFRRASKVAEGIGHGVIAGTSVVSSAATAASAPASSLLNLKSLKDKMTQGGSRVMASFKTESQGSSSSRPTGVAQAMAASAVAAVAATAAATTKRSSSLDGRGGNNMRRSSSIAPSGSITTTVEDGGKVKVSSQSSLTNEQLTAHLTEEERHILEKVFLKEEEFYRQESVVFKPTPSNLNKQLRRLSTRCLPSDSSQSQQQRSNMENICPVSSSPLESPSSSSCASGTNTSATSPMLLGCCRVCRKNIEVGEKHYYCDSCSQPVCEDCSSYSNIREGEVWVCNVCRRRRSTFAVAGSEAGGSLLTSGDAAGMSSLQKRRLSALVSLVLFLTFSLYFSSFKNTVLQFLFLSRFSFLFQICCCLVTFVWTIYRYDDSYKWSPKQPQVISQGTLLQAEDAKSEAGEEIFESDQTYSSLSPQILQVWSYFCFPEDSQSDKVPYSSDAVE